MDEITISGKTYISARRASEIYAYSADHITQLCREGKISCERVAGVWHVESEAMSLYKGDLEQGFLNRKKSESHGHPYGKTKSTGRARSDTINVKGEEYISSARAAKITGYTRDYVGQLAREGHVPAKRVGRVWFLAEKALVAHRNHKDELLQAVQTGVAGPKKIEEVAIQESKSASISRYTAEEKPLRPSVDIGTGVETAVPIKKSTESGPQIREGVYRSTATNIIPVDARQVPSIQTQKRLHLPIHDFQYKDQQVDVISDRRDIRKGEYKDRVYPRLTEKWLIVGLRYILSMTLFLSIFGTIFFIFEHFQLSDNTYTKKFIPAKHIEYTR